MRSALAALLVPMALVFSACGPSVETESNESESVESIDSIYLSVVREGAPLTRTADDETLISLAKSTCEFFDAGASFEDVALIAMESGVDATTAGTVIGAGTEAYCPEYSYLFNGSNI